MRSTFSHSGDIGDIAYAMPTIKALGGGTLLLSQSKTTRIVMNRANIDFVKPLLESQDYIDLVDEYRGEQVCYNLDYFHQYWRENSQYGISLAAWQCRAFSVPESVLNEQWITGLEPKKVSPVIIHRSPRYHNSNFDWKRVVTKYKGKINFVGLASEHSEFTKEFNYVPHAVVKDALEMAQIIAGAEVFIGNQSFPAALAEGLKKHKILETYMIDPNCIFERLDCQNVFTPNMYLPEVC